jgi:hypothetical protein
MKVHDDTVPFHIQEHVYNFIYDSSFKIKGWKDRYYIAKNDMHSNWSLDDLKNSKLYPYLENVYPFDNWYACVVNCAKSNDYFYTHTHGDNTHVILYYANLEWREEWAGETLFYTADRKAMSAYQYVAGRILEFDGSVPHTIRPQSIIGPQYRFTITNLFWKHK